MNEDRETELADETIAAHWNIEPGDVDITTTPAHSGWVARVTVELSDRVERFSEVGWDLETALERLVKASAWRSRNQHRVGSVDDAWTS